MITNSRHSLRLGTLTLSGPDAANTGDYSLDVAADGFDFGTAEAVVAIVESLLRDGDIERVDRFGNRSVTFQVMIDAPTSNGLALGEQALALQLDRPAELSYTPPDALGAETVYEVVTSWMEWAFDNLDELRLHRVFDVTLRCRPRPRSARAVVESALPVSSTSAQVDACDSASGWELVYGLSIAADGAQKWQGTASLLIEPPSQGYEYLGDDRYRYTRRVVVRKTFAAIDFTTTPYLTVAAWRRHSTSLEMRAWVDGAELPLVAAAREAPEWQRFAFYCAETSATVIELELTTNLIGAYGGIHDDWSGPADWEARIDDLERTGSAPSAGSLKQELRVLPISGSTRTEGTLSVARPASALGDVLLASWANQRRGFRPDMRAFFTDGSGSALPDAIHEDALALSVGVFTVPAAIFTPGGYVVLARGRVEFGTDTPLDLSFTTKVAGVPVGPVVDFERPPVFTGSELSIQCVGIAHLPPTVVPEGSGAVMEITWTTSVEIDELWLFPLDGTLTWLDAGAAKYLWLDAPSIDEPHGGIWVGNTSDRFDSWSASHLLRSGYAHHTLTPPSADIFVVTTGGDATETTRLQHYPRWNSTAAHVPGATP